MRNHKRDQASRSQLGVVTHLLNGGVVEDAHALVQTTHVGAEQPQIDHLSLIAIHLNPVTNGKAVFHQHHKPHDEVAQQSLKHEGQRAEQRTTGQHERNGGVANPRDIKQDPNHQKKDG